MAFSKIQIIGNVGRDPELRYTPQGRPVASFTVAVSHSRKNQQTGEWEDGSTDWYNVSVWGDFGERVAETIHKGNRVFVEGRFKTREYERNTGGKGLSLDLTADSVIQMGKVDRGEDAGGGSSFSGAPASSDRAASDDIDELPF